VIVCLTALPALADVAGSAKAIDGDTLEIADQRIRLHGIDAPESQQSCERNGLTWPCGAVASATLREFVRRGEVHCVERDRDRYGRIVAVCRAGVVELNAAMVAAGLALAYRRYSTDYVAQEAAAQAARQGMWAGRFVAPWNWRQGQRLGSGSANEDRPPRAGSGTPAPAISTTCRIKGNISSKGARIYHVPGGQYYDRTRIRASKGERWFCSETEARAAGWRRSKR